VVAQAQNELPQGRIGVRYAGQPAFVSEISTGMQQDLAGPSSLTLLVIAGLFFWTHRRFKPLLWLIALLLLCLALTSAIGGFLFGSLNVVSFGFASILLGLAEDFGIVVYQESRTHPTFNTGRIRALAAPGVFWSALTTCSAFILLNFGGLPGLRQLGTLVAIGVAVAALLMLYLYLPLIIGGSAGAPAEKVLPSESSGRIALLCTVALLLVSACILLVKQPHLNASPEALRPQKSEAYDAAAEMKARLNRSEDPLWVVVTGKTESQVLERLRTAERELTNKLRPGLVATITIPTEVWPDPGAQRTNAPKAQLLVSRRQELLNSVTQGGFAPEAFALADQILSTWSNAVQLDAVFWPTNDASRWILGRFTARNGPDLFALGLINRLPGNDKTTTSRDLIALSEPLAQKGIYVSGWELMGAAVLKHVQERFWKVVIPMVFLIVGSLWLAFRSMREVLLSSAIMLASGLLLCALMALLGWSWNLLNLMSIPLLLGMGVDFSIHMQLALQRYHGDWRSVRQSMGRAILLAGSTTVAGFGSLALSNNAGVASLGKVCASGILIAMLLSVYLLPHWWVWTKQGEPSTK
jgi:predicted exporter